MLKQRKSNQSDCQAVELNEQNAETVVSFDYRPLVGFLTETIDTCILKESEHRARLASENIEFTADRVVEQNRKRLDRAMHALENTIQLILTELDERRWSGAIDDDHPIATGQPEKWLAEVFPDDDAGRQLLSLYKGVRPTRQ